MLLSLSVLYWPLLARAVGAPKRTPEEELYYNEIRKHHLGDCPDGAWDCLVTDGATGTIVPTPGGFLYGRCAHWPRGESTAS